MTPDETKTAAELMLKWAADPTIPIECRGAKQGQWHAEEHPRWNWGRVEYREAPKTVERNETQREREVLND